MSDANPNVTPPVTPPAAPVTPPVAPPPAAPPAVPPPAAAPPVPPATPPPAEPPKAEGTPPAEPPKPPEPVKLKLPEGTTLPPTRLAELETLAKEKGLTPEQAQSRIDAEAGYHDKLVADHGRNVEAWKSALKADPIYGGQKLEETVEAAHRALKTMAERVGDTDIVQVLDASGYGNYPGLVKIFAEVGKLMSAKPLVPGGTPPSEAPRSDSEIFYGPNRGKAST